MRAKIPGAVPGRTPGESQREPHVTRLVRNRRPNEEPTRLSKRKVRNMSKNPLLFSTTRNRVAAFLCGLALASAPSYALAEVLYSTSFEAPEFMEGPLGSQGGWEYSFGTDPVVTSAFSRTGDQSLVVSGTGAFGQNQLLGPFSTSKPQISIEYSLYLDESSDWSNTFITWGFSAPGTFLGQIPVRNGSEAVLRPADENLFPTPIELGTWIDLELVFDFSSQTQEGFVNGLSIGSTAFPNPATELTVGQLFFTNFDENDITFYVDDLSITAVPEPSTFWLLSLGGVGLIGFRLRRRVSKLRRPKDGLEG